MITPQTLLVSSRPDGGTPPVLFQVVHVVAPLLLLLTLRIRMHSRGAQSELGGEDCFGAVDEEERSFPVARLGVVRLAHSTAGSSSTHPFPCLASTS